MKRASISELKDGLSAHLDRVRSGEIVVITDRKSPIATIQRIPPGSLNDSEQRMVADGIVAPRKQRLKIDALLSMPLADCRHGLASAILQERADTR